MSILLADIDATCAALGYFDGEKYRTEPDAIQGLKHLIWILRRDIENHEYRRHLGRAKVLQTDLVQMLPDYIDDEDYADVLIRLLVILTNPTLLLYRDGLPKDGPGRKVYMELIDILQGYKSAFTLSRIWAALTTKLHKSLEIDWSIRSEEQGLLIERILVLVRNVLQVPSNPELECRADNDASLHDQVIWALQQSGMLDLVLYILSSADENQYHLHALEIVCLMFREQTAECLADASLQRSAAEKHRDEEELIAIRRRERQKLIAQPPPARHSRFGGTYVLQNVKSVSDKDIICHQSLERAVSIDFDREKSKLKRSFRIVKETGNAERRSAFSVRLCLREYCIEVLRSAYNTLVRQVRRVLERNIGGGSGHDDSYLLWAVRFFMEFNRLSGMQLDLVSESLSVQCFHWVLTRIQHDMDMIVSDKKNAQVWGRRLHVGIQTFRELLLSVIALKRLPDEKAQDLFNMLLNNVCYVLEYRENVLHLLISFNENWGTKSYLRDIIEMANIFIKLMEKFCQVPVVVQDKRRQQHRKKGAKKSQTKQSKQQTGEETQDDLEDMWSNIVCDLSTLLTQSEINISEEKRPIPFDATSEKPIDDQREDCMLRIYRFLREEGLEEAILLMRSAREVWPENDCFGAMFPAPEDELMLLREIFFSKLGPVEKQTDEVDIEENRQESEDDTDEEEEDEPPTVEKDFRFDDFLKRLLNQKIIRACTLVLADWETIPTKSLKAAVTILYRIAFVCKCPAMLYQATLFKIFQKVFNTPRSKHNEELRRFGVYVVRQFVEMAPKNPKIYAELLFWKSLKEANDLEMGYTNTYNGAIKGAWTEEQENELRMLFEENQSNPTTDQDVIDWILDNLIDKTRTRRGILKKLKDMGLMFKAPTKRSTASAANKNLWQYEEDEQLRNLYDEFRIQDDCLARIMDVCGEKRSKQNIIKRMIQLGLIADRSEIVPKKSKRNKKVNEGKQTKNRSTKKTKKPVVRSPLDVASVKFLIAQNEEKFKDAIEWLKECLQDAAEGCDEISEDADDGVPLLALQTIEKEAIEDETFKRLLLALGVQPPIEENETYWKIPVYLKAADLQMRVQVLDGTYDPFLYENLTNTTDGDSSNQSSDDDDNSNNSRIKTAWKPRNQRQIKQTKKQTFPKKSPKTNKPKRMPLDVSNIKIRLNEIDEKFKDAIDWLKESLKDATDEYAEKSTESDDGVPLVPIRSIELEAMEDENFKQFLTSLGFRKPVVEVEMYWKIPVDFTRSDLETRIRILDGTYTEENVAEVVVDMSDEKESSSSDSSDNEDNSSNSDSSDTNDGSDVNSHGNFLSKRRQHFDNLVFNRSDNEDEPPVVLNRKGRKNLKSNKPPPAVEVRKASRANKIGNKNDLKSLSKSTGRKINIEDMLQSGTADDRSNDNDEMSNDNILDDFDSENLRLRLNELRDNDDDDDDDGSDDYDVLGNRTNLPNETDKSAESSKRKSRIRRNVIDSDSSDDENNDDDNIAKKHNDAGVPIDSFQEDNSYLASDSVSKNTDNHHQNGSVNNQSSSNANSSTEMGEVPFNSLRVSPTPDDNDDDVESLHVANVNNKRGHKEINADSEDEDDVVVKKRKSTDTNNENRRRVAVIDDDSE